MSKSDNIYRQDVAVKPQRKYIGVSPSGKATDSDSVIRRFKSFYPSQWVAVQCQNCTAIFYAIKNQKSVINKGNFVVGFNDLVSVPLNLCFYFPVC